MTPVQVVVVFAALVVVGAGPALAASDAALIKSAMSAAPPSVSRNATIVTFNDKMEMRVIRKGTNNFTCAPDDPTTPGNDPVCGDQGAMSWLQALISHQPPPVGTTGIAYMLQGASDASNTDPFATKPAAGETWLKTGPHIMIYGLAADLKDFPHGAKPDASAPYVMFPGTPYEHLMVPVK